MTTKRSTTKRMIIMLVIAAKWERETPSSVGFTDEIERCETVRVVANRTR